MSAYSEDLEKDLLVESDIIQVSWRNTNLRWLALFCCCMMMVGMYMCMDFPQYL